MRRTFLKGKNHDPGSRLIRKESAACFSFFDVDIRVLLADTSDR